MVTAMMGDGDDHVRLLAGLATVDGEAGNDIFLFEAAVTGFRIDGGDGNDEFFGAGFASSGEALGGAGNDRFSGFGEGVTLAGGSGHDSYRIDIGSGALVVERPREGADTIETEATADFTLPSGVENLVVGDDAGAPPVTLTGNLLDNKMAGGGGAETMNGLDGDDSLYGGGGDDLLHGGRGDDMLNGGSGNDGLFGGSGDDWLRGGDGDDWLQGDEGGDTLTGGAGADYFLFLLASDSAGGSFDRIADFTPRDGDVIDLSAIDADLAVPGDQAFIWSETTPTANGLWYGYVDNGDGTWEVAWFADVNGDAIADFELYVHQIGVLAIGTDILL